MAVKYRRVSESRFLRSCRNSRGGRDLRKNSFSPRLNKSESTPMSTSRWLESSSKTSPRFLLQRGRILHIRTSKSRRETAIRTAEIIGSGISSGSHPSAPGRSSATRSLDRPSFLAKRNRWPKRIRQRRSPSTSEDKSIRLRLSREI